MNLKILTRTLNMSIRCCLDFFSIRNESQRYKFSSILNLSLDWLSCSLLDWHLNLCFLRYLHMGETRLILQVFHHRSVFIAIAWVGLGGALKIIPFQPAARCHTPDQSHRAHQTWPWTLPGLGQLQLLWATCSSASKSKFLLFLFGEFYLGMAPLHPQSGIHWNPWIHWGFFCQLSWVFLSVSCTDSLQFCFSDS